MKNDNYPGAIKRRRFLLSAGALVATAATGAWLWPLRWRYIVIHHSGGSYGNIGFLQRMHRQRQANDPIDAIPYHYIIGNGNGMAMGEVASDWRQEYGLWGAHLSNSNPMRNFTGIGICLIGNYQVNDVPEAQYQALLTLTRQLMSRYGIPPENVTGHGKTMGEHTKCPGGRFPMARLKKDIARVV